MRELADICTLLRILLALAIIVLSIISKLSIESLAALYFLGWLSDNLDGYFARRSGRNGRLAKIDPYADTLLVISGLVLVSYKLHAYSPKFVLGYTVFWMISVWATKNQAVWMLFSFGGLLLAFSAAWRKARSLALFAIVWALGTAIVKRKALIEHINRFLTSIKSVL